MKNKLTKYLGLGVICLGAIYSLGVSVVYLNVDKAIEKSISSCNQFLHEKYKQGLFIEDLKLVYKKESSSVIGQSGEIVLKSTLSDSIFKIPVDVCYGFLNTKATFDFKQIIYDLFIKQNVLSNESDSKGILNIRFFPYSMNFKVDLLGDYSQFLKDQGFVKTSLNDKYTKLKGQLIVSEDFLGNTFKGFELNNVTLPSIRADKIYFDCSTVEENKIQKPKSATIYAQNFDREIPIIGRINLLSTKIVASNLSKDGNFNLYFDTDLTTQNGHLLLDGILGDFSAKSLENDDKSFVQLFANPMLINKYASSDSLLASFDNVSFVSNQNTKDGLITYNLDALGTISIPKSSEGIADVTDEIQGAFDIKVSNLNSLGRTYIQTLGFGIFEPNGDNFESHIDITNGNLSFNNKNFD